MTTTPEGWGWPLLAKKAHYFRSNQSLCGRWLFTGSLDPDNGKKSLHDCVPCGKALDKEKAS